MNRATTRALRAVWAWLPAALRVDARERWRAVAGATLGLLVAALASRWVGTQLAISPWLAAPLGASAVLVFAVPASPLAQPWSVIGGNTLSALVGLACARLLPDTALAAAAAVGAAIALMFLLRCLHPPGGATALLAVLTHATDWRFALLPVLLNSVLLVIVGVAYNTLTGRRYPHVQLGPAAPPSPRPGARFSPADLDAALAHYNQVLDVSRDDLEALLHFAESAAYQRNLGELRCRDVMSRDPLTVSHDTPVVTGWTMMRERAVKALPVVDKSHHVIGIVTLADFVRALVGDDSAPRAAPGRVGDIMTRRVRVASEDRHVIELLPLFSEGGHHHLPVVDAQQHLVGILTQSDVVRALHRAVRPD